MHLAQVNISRLAAPLDSPALASFVDNLERINGLAERSPGFVWRLTGDGDDATSIRPYDDPDVLINLTVWESIESLFDFAYRSNHIDYVRRRNEYFVHLGAPSVALWWIPEGHIPTVWEAKERLELLRTKGATQDAFTFRKLFGPLPDDAASDQEPAAGRS